MKSVNAIFCGGRESAAKAVHELSGDCESALVEELRRRGTTILRCDEMDCYLVFRRYKGRNYWTGLHAETQMLAAQKAVSKGYYEPDDR